MPAMRQQRGQERQGIDGETVCEAEAAAALLCLDG